MVSRPSETRKEGIELAVCWGRGLWGTLIDSVVTTVDTTATMGQTIVRATDKYYRAVAGDVTTVKQCNTFRALNAIFRALSTSVWQKSGRFYSDL